MFNDKSMGYYERLRTLGLTTLGDMRLRGDVTEEFKIFKGIKRC